MLILAFETSCDDTAVALVRDGTKVLASRRTSQPEHNQYGGVVPEIAARLHADNWKKVLKDTFESAHNKQLIPNISITDVDAIAVTQGPGLQTALLTGTTAASYLSLLYRKPIIPVHHILGHLTSTVLDRNANDTQFPNMVLTVSGGHTSIYYRKSFTNVQCIGKTIDDAAGEAYDKCAKMLGLGYPGGPIVSQWAQKGDSTTYKFPIILLGKDSLDFSFSGLKAAVYRVVEAYKERYGSKFSVNFIANVCASFEATVSTILVKKIERSLDRYPLVKELHFVGGVSANKCIRANLYQALRMKSVSLFVPSKQDYCTDNAAMIGAAAYFIYQKNPEIFPAMIEASSKLLLNKS